MACLSENQIVEFFQPERSPDVTAQVDAHTAVCDGCRRLLAEYAQLSAAHTAATQIDPTARLGLAALPTLTPGASPQEDRVDLVHRLAQAQARKYVGTVVKGKWEIEALLGTGGMAHVFAARHRNGRGVAIKCMRPELMLERALVERFLREGYVANKIAHPGAVAILDDDVMDDGTPFLVMELLVGRTLRQRLERGPLPLDAALGAIAQVLDLLAVAHEKGIIHRDLKPDNLFETETGLIKVLDFGIARLKERTRPDFETRSGTTMGTVGYMPPEQARGLSAQVDARSDVWAVGATLFALITGRPVHEATTTNEALLLAMTRPVPPMHTILPSLSAGVQRLLDTALAFDKGDRYPSARAMKEALDAAALELTDTEVFHASARAAFARPAIAATAILEHEPAAQKVLDGVPAPSARAAVEPPRRRRIGAFAVGIGGVSIAALGLLGIRAARHWSSSEAATSVSHPVEGASASPPSSATVAALTNEGPAASSVVPVNEVLPSNDAGSVSSVASAPPVKPADARGRNSANRPKVSATVPSARAPSPPPSPVPVPSAEPASTEPLDPLGPRH